MDVAAAEFSGQRHKVGNIIIDWVLLHGLDQSVAPEYLAAQAHTTSQPLLGLLKLRSSLQRSQAVEPQAMMELGC